MEDRTYRYPFAIRPHNRRPMLYKPSGRFHVLHSVERSVSVIINDIYITTCMTPR
jgi:hypothetical protein